MSHEKPHVRSSIKLQPARPRRHFLGLMSRMLPAFVLAIGMLVLMSVLDQAQAQYPPQQQTYPQGFPAQFSPAPSAQPEYRVADASSQIGAQNYQSGIPEVPAQPSTATDQIGGEAANPGKDEASGGSWFQTPDFVTKIMSGGWLMLPLAICSLVVLSLSLERLIALRRSRVIPKPFVLRFTECVEDGVLSYDEATELCKEFDCPVSEVFRAALRRWGRPMFEIEQAVMDAGDRVAEGLRKYLRVFHAISNVAPLIGLLGTVIGMIDAFEIISDQASLGRPELLASGISMALMTTAGGLSVAIPAYLAYMYFSSKSDRYLVEIEKLCQRVIDCISAEGLETTNASRSKRRKAA
ncbi:MotA/TolQ/ExbB proton channel family protein [Roseiconus lacunae]|uniref:MotA/TolQ/ExbB proton channel family protein n=1 Tax=Roseiconus lacunae TaxID=2605694 RepID=UPI0011F20078|nr:MotA/TolQ/ExbB proton channel family protein [Roseiconus lacunae]